MINIFQGDSILFDKKLKLGLKIKKIIIMIPSVLVSLAKFIITPILVFVGIYVLLFGVFMLLNKTKN